MAFIDITKELLNETLTENGDKAYLSTLSPCLDFFGLVGGKRNHLNEAVALFAKAFMDDRLTALKLLFYTRDIHEGLGERRIFRFLFNGIAVSYPNIAKELIKYIPEYGRYDDLLCALETPIEDYVVEYISNQLEEDMANKKEGKSISLLSKWLPSINTSSDEARYFANYIANKLNMTKADYRKMLSYLRKDLIIENNLREKDYTFDYSKVPSVALNKYIDAFDRNDKERFDKYIEDIKQGSTTMNVAKLDVVNFIKQVKKNLNNNEVNKDYYITTWDELVKEGELDSRTIVVRDGSGSMTWSNFSNTLPIDIADALTLLTSSRLTGEFSHKFITFSSKPQLVDLSYCRNIFDMCNKLSEFDDYTNTNIQKVYDLILKVYKSPNFKKEDALSQILIISDMEFDALISDKKNMSTFEHFKDEFEKIGYDMPEVVFWNVESCGDKLPVTQHETGVKLVSGSNKNVIDLVVNNKSIDPLDFMYKVLKKYDFIDKLDFKEE